MKTPRLSPRALGGCAILAMLAGCGGAQTTSATVPQAVMPDGTPARGPVAIKPQSSGDLLYVSDAGTNDVYALSYPSGGLVTTLTGFGAPQGLCADSSGDVYVTDEKNADVAEYAHGGTSPIKTLQASGRPSACWVDPTTGNVAVSNINSFVSIYKNGSGSPTNYSTSTSAAFCAYDSRGNLYVVEPGQLSTGNVVQVLPSGGTSFGNVNLNKRLGNFWPAGIQSYGKDLVVAHEGPYQYGCCGRVYRFTVKGANGRHAGSFQTTDLVDVFVYNSKLIAAIGSDKVALYDYPKGGGEQTIGEPGYSSYSVTISVAPSGSRSRK
jgi:NHL repeat